MKPTRMMSRVAVPWLILSLCLAMPALGHQPRMVTGDSVTVRQPEISQAFYAELHGRSQLYHITAPQPFHLYVQLTVPAMPKARTDFTVFVTRDDRLLQRLDGASATWRRFYEPFAGDAYLEGPEYDEAAAAPGHYRIVVSSPDQRGKYVLVIGKRESFTLADWLRVLAVLPQVKRFMGKSPLTAYFNLTGLFLLIPVLFIAGVILAVVIVRRRRKRKARQTA